jgi:hypothetical protein
MLMGCQQGVIFEALTMLHRRLGVNVWIAIAVQEQGFVHARPPNNPNIPLNGEAWEWWDLRGGGGRADMGRPGLVKRDQALTPPSRILRQQS